MQQVEEEEEYEEESEEEQDEPDVRFPPKSQVRLEEEIIEERVENKHGNKTVEKTIEETTTSQKLDLKKNKPADTGRKKSSNEVTVEASIDGNHGQPEKKTSNIKEDATVKKPANSRKSSNDESNSLTVPIKVDEQRLKPSGFGEQNINVSLEGNPKIHPKQISSVNEEATVTQKPDKKPYSAESNEVASLTVNTQPVTPIINEPEEEYYKAPSLPVRQTSTYDDGDESMQHWLDELFGSGGGVWNL